MRVTAIPEDQELDRYIVKPVLEALLEDLRPNVRLDVLPEPRLRGLNDALNSELLAQIVADNPMTDLFVLVVDRDCDRENSSGRAAARERELAHKVIHVVAIEEIEVWMLALHDLDVPFAQVRAHCDPKEEYALPFLQQLGSVGPGQGRKSAMKAISGSGWRRLCQRCPEIADLRERIRARLEGGG